MKKNATQKQIEAVLNFFSSKGCTYKDASSADVSLYGIIGDTKSIMESDVYAFEAVDKITRIQEPYKKASKTLHPEPTIIDVSGVKIGGGTFTIMAGPCSVESKEQLFNIADAVKQSGAKILRGGAYKPRTSPYAFQGLGEVGLDILAAAKKEYHLPIVTEIYSAELIPLFLEKGVDIFQVGARNMQNYDLLKALGKIRKPVMLKRGMDATIEEWLLAAEYILAGGNEQVILCERGIKTFDRYTRNCLDIQAVLAIKQLSHLPIIVDPSHASGRYDMIEDLAKAALVVGADGIIVEVHNHPECALSDGAQSLKPEKFYHMVRELEKLAPLCGKTL